MQTLTRKSLIDLLTVRIGGGKPSDDIELEPRQIGLEIDIAAQDILQKASDKIVQDDTTEFLYVRFPSIPVLKETTATNIDGYVGYYSDLPATPIALPSDQGIKIVETSGGELVKRRKVTDSYLYTFLPFVAKEKTYSRIGQRIYYQNLNSVFAKYGYVNMVIAIGMAFGEIGDNDTYPIPSYLVSNVVDVVYLKLKDQLGIPQDFENDGKSLNQGDQ